MTRPKPLALIILDGWGLNPNRKANAVALAETPVFDALWSRWPRATLLTHGPHVGLREGQIGNSNVGHLNLGAGRIVYQDLVRIDRALADGSLAGNPTLRRAVADLPPGATVHLLGLLSDGGVHSHIDHILGLWRIVEELGAGRVVLHVFLDGRDVPPRSALEYLERLEAQRGSQGLAAVATVSGRYYAMDRDRRWDRVRRAYDALTAGRGRRAADPRQAVREAYRRGESDEFVEPTVIVRGGRPVATIGPNDLVIFCNFRADRARQLTRALFDPEFSEFPRPAIHPAQRLLTMTVYDDTFPTPALLPANRIERPFGQWIAEAGLTQLRLAETEKYAHVTYFFNGGEEQVFPGEDRILVPSPKVATYDLKPEMSAPEVTEEAVTAIRRGEHDVIVMNYANPDMVGHTGVLEAAVKACEAVDRGLGRVIDALLSRGGAALVCADHGNAELMVDPDTGQPHTAHTTNPVPVILVSPVHRHRRLRHGVLADVAPTLCELLGLTPAPEMDRPSLLV